jgi:hypothetical protein
MSSATTTSITSDTHVIWSIPQVRRYIGWIGMLFPPVLLAGHLFLDPPKILDAISDYHYSDSMHRFLVVFVLALGVLLIYYQYRPVDNRLSTFAGLCAMGVALFPPAPVVPPDCHPPSCIPPSVWQYRVDAVHHTCAVFFIGSLAFIVLFLFTKSSQTQTLLAVPFAQTRKNLADLVGRRGWARLEGAVRPSVTRYPLDITPRKYWRNQFYEGAGIVIAVCLALCIAIDGPHLFSPPPTTVFWLETIAVWSFALAWLVKGEAYPFRGLYSKEDEAAQLDHNAPEPSIDPSDVPGDEHHPDGPGNGADGGVSLMSTGGAATTSPGSPGSTGTQMPRQRAGVRSYLVPGYGVGLVVTSLWVPVVAAIATALLYLPSPVTASPKPVILIGCGGAIVLWLLSAFFFAVFAKPGAAFSGVYGHIRNSLAQVAGGAGLLTTGLSCTRINTQQSAVDDLARHAPTYVNDSERYKSPNATGSTATISGKAASEVVTCLSRLEASLCAPGLQWALGQGYTNAWELLYWAEEALLYVAADADVYQQALRDQDRLKGSTLNGADQMRMDSKTSLDTIFASGSTQPSDQEKMEKMKARAQLRQVKANINQFRIERMRGIVRARNLLLAMTLATQWVLYAILVLAITMGASPTTVATALLFYLIGAGIGLFGATLVQRRQTTAVNDYGFSMSRSILTTVPSGTAAVAGVFVMVMLYGTLLGPYLSAPAARAATAAAATITAPAALAATPAKSATAGLTLTVSAATPAATVAPSAGAASSGGSTATASCSSILSSPADMSRKLMCIYDLDADPYGLLLAAVFGLVPATLVGILQQQANRYVVDLKASEPSASSTIQD